METKLSLGEQIEQLRYQVDSLSRMTKFEKALANTYIDNLEKLIETPSYLDIMRELDAYFEDDCFYYSPTRNTFYIKTQNGTEVDIVEESNGTVNIIFPLPYETIEMIGKFYRGQS